MNDIFAQNASILVQNQDTVCFRGPADELFFFRPEFDAYTAVYALNPALALFAMAHPRLVRLTRSQAAPVRLPPQRKTRRVPLLAAAGGLPLQPELGHVLPAPAMARQIRLPRHDLVRKMLFIADVRDSNLAVQSPTVSGPLEQFLVDCSSESVHFALLVYLFMSSCIYEKVRFASPSPPAEPVCYRISSALGLSALQDPNYNKMARLLLSVQSSFITQKKQNEMEGNRLAPSSFDAAHTRARAHADVTRKSASGGWPSSIPRSTS
jgi:hypothetical protein